MSLRENALRIIRFGAAERVTSGPPTYGIAYHGANHEGYEGGGHDCPPGACWRDIWGTLWQKEREGVMGFPRGVPLPDAVALRRYRWPDPDDPRICDPIHTGARGFGGQDALLCGSHRDTLWEKAYMLVGMERMMLAFYEEPGFAEEILRRIMDFQLGIARHYLEVGVEMVALSDDLGTQRGPLLSPEIVERFLVPQYRRLFGLYRDRRVIVSFHSCGAIEAFLEVFLRLGVDILNPVQETANDLTYVRSQTQGKMALQGAVSSATVMDGPPEAIEAKVRQRLWSLGRDGGYFCAPDQGLPFPQGHLDAFERALEKYGRYPLSDPADDL